MALYFYDKYNVNSSWVAPYYRWSTYAVNTTPEYYDNDTGWVAKSNTTISVGSSWKSSVTFSSSKGFTLSGDTVIKTGMVGTTVYWGYSTNVDRYEIVGYSGGDAIVKRWGRLCDWHMQKTTKGTFISYVDSANRNTYPDNGTSGSVWYVYEYNGGGYYNYTRGTFVSTVQAEEGVYPNDSRHTDGYWYVKQALAIIRIGTYKIAKSGSIIELPIFDPSVGMTGKNQLRTFIGSTVGCFELVDVSDTKASPLRIMTKTGVKAVAKI